MSACQQCLSAALEQAMLVHRLEQDGAVGDLYELLEAPRDESLSASCSGAVDLLSAAAARYDLWMICRHDPAFPAALTRFRRPSDVPHVLFGRGDRTKFDQLASSPSVALVGARRATAYGREVSYTLGHECTAAEINVISGMALGIDGAAHRGALSVGGTTIAVLAGGAERPYPRSHRLLYEQILERGCVISETPPGFTARRWGFVARNRIIAGLSSLTVLVEGSTNSGARHCVDYARELELPIGTVPGPITSPMSAGPNALLREDGILAIRGFDDIRSVIQPQPSATGSSEPLDPAARVLAEIASGCHEPQTLAEALGDISGRALLKLLGDLELRGQVRRGPAGQYECCLQERKE